MFLVQHNFVVKMVDKAELAVLEQQRQLAKRINSFVSNYLKTPKDRINLGYLNARLEGLNALWAEFSANHDVVSAVASAEEIATCDYWLENEYEKYEQHFYDISGKIHEKKRELSAPSEVPAPNAPPAHPVPSTSSAAPAASMWPSSHPQPQQPYASPVHHPMPIHPDPPLVPAAGLQAHHIQIPRLNVPPFSGAYEDWPLFRDLFVAAVHSNPTLPAVHKLQYLKSLLTGDAQTILRHTPTTTDNYAIAWGKLEERFDNKRALINTTLRQFFNQRSADESAPSIRHLLDTTRECIGALHVHGVDTASWDSILIYVVSQHVPATSLDLWEQQIPRNQLPTIDNLLQFLEDRFRALEFAAARAPAQSNRTRAKPQAFHAATSGCRVCNGPQHPLRLCPKFLEMSPSQRLSHVAKAKLCKNCFAFSHQTQACRSNGTCTTCTSALVCNRL